jgi:hypothetical protein
MPSAHRRSRALIAVALSVLTTLTTAVSVFAGGSTGPWPQ